MTELLFSGGTPDNEGIYDDTDEGLLKRVKDNFKLSADHSRKWRQETREDYDFVAGEQWSEEDKQKLREQLRPEITFNRTGAVVDAVIGQEINNRQEVRYIPREVGDSGVNEVLTGAGSWVRDECDAEDEETDAFLDTVICGMGWTETHLDYEEDLDGQIKIDRVDPLEMFWDPDAKKQNLADARWLMRVKEISVEDMKALWPDKYSEVVERGPWDRPTDEDMGIETNANEPDEYAHQDPIEWAHRRRKGTRRVVEFQWWEREPVYRIAHEGGLHFLNEPKWQRAKEVMEARAIQVIDASKRTQTQLITQDTVFYFKQQRRKYRRAFISGATILERTDCPCDTRFTYQAVTGKRNRNSNTWYGIVRGMKDPQRWANKWLSQTMNIINTNSKGGVMVEDGAVDNPREFETKWARSDGVVHVSQGAISKGMIQEKPGVQYPAGLDRLMEFAVSSIYQVPGINLEMLGLADRTQPGVLEYQRRESGLNILAGMFNALRRYRKNQGRVLLFFIMSYISDGRLIRIVGPKGARYVPLLKQDGAATYDIIVDEAASSPNQKERTFQILMQMLPTLAKMGLPLPPELLDYSPLPESLAQKWKEQLQGQGNQQMQAHLQKIQEQLQKTLEENQKLKTGEAAKMAKVAVDKAVAQVKLELQEEQMKGELALKAFEVEEELDIKREQARDQAKIARTYH